MSKITIDGETREYVNPVTAETLARAFQLIFDRSF